MLKKSLSFLLSVILCLSVLTFAPVSVSAGTINSDEAVGQTRYVNSRSEYKVKVGETLRMISAQNSAAYEYVRSHSLYYVSGDKDAGDYDEFYSYASDKWGFEFTAKKSGKIVLRHAITRYTLDSSYLVMDVTWENTYEITVTSDDDPVSTPHITGCSSTDSGVQINWGAVDDAVKYRVFYKGKNGCTKLGDTTSTSFVDTKVSSGATYTYTVRCMNSSGTKYTSGYDKSGTTYTYNLGTPQIKTLTSSAAGVKITWGEVANAKKYSVFYKGKNGWVKMANVTGTSYTDSDVNYGRTYTYTVRCIKSDGSRYISAYNGSGWKHTHYLNTPGVTSVTSTSDGVKLSWSRVADAAKYRVFYRNKYGGWTKLGDTASTSFTDSDVNLGRSYTYTVRCIDSAGKAYTSSYNSNGWTHTYQLNIATPRIKTAETVSNGIKLSWNAVSGASRYRVFYKGKNGWTKLTDTSQTSCVDTEVTYGKAYTYTVRCISNDGKRYISSYDGDGIRAYYYAVPKIVEVNSDDSSVSFDIECTHNSLVDHYKFWYKSGSD